MVGIYTCTDMHISMCIKQFVGNVVPQGEDSTSCTIVDSACVYTLTTFPNDVESCVVTPAIAVAQIHIEQCKVEATYEVGSSAWFAAGLEEYTTQPVSISML